MNGPSFEELICAWAKSQGFQDFQSDHNAVLRNLAKWLDEHVDENAAPDKCKFPKAFPFCSQFSSGDCKAKDGICRAH